MYVHTYTQTFIPALVMSPNLKIIQYSSTYEWINKLYIHIMQFLLGNKNEPLIHAPNMHESQHRVKRKHYSPSFSFIF